MEGVYYVGGKPYIKGRPASALDLEIAGFSQEQMAKEQAAAQAKAAMEAAAIQEAQRAAEAAKAAQKPKPAPRDSLGMALDEARRSRAVGMDPGAAIKSVFGLGSL